MRISDWSSDVCSSDLHERVVAELRIADRRMRIINNSILSAVACGIVVCLLVALLFTQAFTGVNLGVAASWAFAAAMLLLLVSLILFLVAVRLAVPAIHVPMDLPALEDRDWMRRRARGCPAEKFFHASPARRRTGNSQRHFP